MSMLEPLETGTPSTIPGIVFVKYDMIGMVPDSACKVCAFTIGKPDCAENRCSGGLYLTTMDLITRRLKK